MPTDLPGPLPAGRLLPEPPSSPPPQVRPADGHSPAAAPFGRVDQRDDAGLMEYWRLARRHKGTLILAGILGGLLGLFITLPQTPIYQVRTSLEIQDINENFMNMKQVNPVSDASGSATPADMQTHIKILQSDSVIGAAMEKLQAEPSSEASAPSKISRWREALKLPTAEPVDERQVAIAMAAGTVRVRAAGQARVLEITCDSTDPQMAASFANALTREYIRQNVESRWQMTQNTGEWLTRQLDDMRIKLERSEDGLQSYANRSGLVFTGDTNRENISDQKLRQLQESLSTAQATRVARQSRFEIASASPAESLADILNDPNIRETQNKITALQQELAELRIPYTAEHARVKRLEAQIATLKEAFKRDRDAILKRIANDFHEAQQHENLLAADYAAQARLVNDQAAKLIHYNILKREVDSNRQLYEAMLQRVKEAGIASAMRASNVRVVDPAKAPSKPYKPDLQRGTKLGLVAGLILGFVFIVVRERSDRTIQSPGDAALYLNLTELGMIPGGKSAAAARNPHYYLSKAQGSRLLAVGESLNGDSGSAVHTNGDGPPERIELVTWQRQPSLVAESFRSAMTSILRSARNGSAPKVIVVTSAGPAEGKTTVATNLAIAFAEIQHRVLLIDADLRKPRVHDLFGLENESGLSPLLRSGPSDGDAFHGVVRETPVPNLYILPSGPPTAAAASLLYSARMAASLERFRREFDMVVIDTPPALQMPDARIVGTLADGVILVVRAGQTSRDAALAVRQRFLEDGARVIGAVLNDWNAAAGRRGEAYGYYNRYYYKSYNGYHETVGK